MKTHRHLAIDRVWFVCPIRSSPPLSAENQILNPAIFFCFKRPFQSKVAKLQHHINQQYLSSISFLLTTEQYAIG
jgi:hypothetical protein